MWNKLTIVLLVMVFSSGACVTEGTFTTRERTLIETEDSLTGRKMRVLTVDNYEDSVFLRNKCRPVTKKMVRDGIFTTLTDRMLETVNDPLNPGVGIAAPQVGVGLRVILVQRYDLPGEPFGVYVNPEIISAKGNAVSREGCLSIPEVTGLADRHERITICYMDTSTLEYVTEDVDGFTAIIFQHETDHLDGILFTDKLTDIQNEQI